MKIVAVAGARPNFIKISALYQAFRKIPGCHFLLVHTGQHYDSRMSDIFFEQLSLPAPARQIKSGNNTSTGQIAYIMLEFEKIITEESPDCVLVVGDVNSTLACALVCAKEQVPLAHVEAGLRSGDRSMPEEINRIVTDSVADLLFVSELSGIINLGKEGIAPSRVHLVGNVMIDTLAHFGNAIDQASLPDGLPLPGTDYAMATFHRPANVDNKEKLRQLVDILRTSASQLEILFPVHPRTANRLETFGLLESLKSHPQIRLLPPMDYFGFIKLLKHARVALTDSGGIQEETTWLGIPCLTLRETTERPATIDFGTNILVNDATPSKIEFKLANILNQKAPKRSLPPLWDGKAADRIAEIVLKTFG